MSYRFSRLLLALCLLLVPAGASWADPCVVTDNGSGTVELPPAGCAYLSPNQVHEIIRGLPAGTTIKLAPIHTNFICRKLGLCGTPGGILGGEKEIFNSDVILIAQGTGPGPVGNYQRTITLPLAAVETHTAPRTPGAPVQTFATEMFSLVGQISGDPDFDLLRIVAGTNFGYPSPGQTTLTQLDNGDWKVDSVFDVSYEITFQGSPNGIFKGMGGTSRGRTRMSAAAAPDVTTVPGTNK